MPRNPRCVEAGQIYHVTQRGVNQQTVFSSQTDRNTYLSLAAKNVADCQVHILAWCIMSNHVHWVVKADRKNSLAVFFRRVNGRYAQYFNARRDRTGHLWQNRFFSCMLGPTHLWRALRYVEGNPVRAGLVEQSRDYRWSSAQSHFVGPSAETIQLLDWDFWNEHGGAKGWNDLVGGIEDVRLLAEIRECTYSGKPFGDTGFLEQMQETFQRHWRSPGRPKKPQILKREMGKERSAFLERMQMSTGSG